MLLAVDCGNTNTVFSIWDGTQFIGTWRTSTEWQRTADQYYVWLSTLMKFQKVEADITDMIISSTVPRVVFNLRVLADRYFHTRPIVVGKPECKLPVDVRVDAGTAVGPDRLVNTVAGYDLFGGDLIVVDFGTATTFDVVDSDGAYIGGVIAPGINLSLDALVGKTDQLPRIALDIARRRQCQRHNHRKPDADRNFLGLCCDDRRASSADKGANRPTDQDHCYRRISRII